VVNVLTGPVTELAPWLAGHLDVDALDLTGADPASVAVLEREAAENLKRVRRPAAEDWAAEPALDRLTWVLEAKTVWHPTGV
jgi:hypothetical protein